MEDKNRDLARPPKRMGTLRIIGNFLLRNFICDDCGRKQRTLFGESCKYCNGILLKNSDKK